MVKIILQIPCQKIISGGQTGVDRGILDAALENSFLCGGWCPKGRLAEDGKIAAHYPLRETVSDAYETRTRKNVDDSDGTLIIAESELLTGGTLLTKEYALTNKKPVLVVTPSENREDGLKKIVTWINKNSLSVLNIAGPRRSEWEAGYRIAYKIVETLIYQINNSITAGESNSVDFKK